MMYRQKYNKHIFNQIKRKNKVMKKKVHFRETFFTICRYVELEKRNRGIKGQL